LTSSLLVNYDIAPAKVFGQILAKLEETGTILPDAELHIAAIAIYHDLENEESIPF
jgi:predicted nucleic acid-binding protein